MDEILVGLDGSPGSLRALEWATDAASAFGSGILGIYVLTPSSAFWRDLSFEGMTAWRQQIPRLLVRDWLAPARAHGVPVRGELIEWDTIHGGLLRSADQANARMIVLGGPHHAHSPLGSISDKVMHHASQPVVVVPRPRPMGHGARTDNDVARHRS